MVDATAQTATSRLASAEEYRRLIGHVSKSLRNAKDIRTKRVSECTHAQKHLELIIILACVSQGLEQLQRVQGDVVDALRELHRVKKSYHQLSHITSVARDKAADAQSRSVEWMTAT